MTKLDELIKAFSGLQGIGRKSAARIAFDLLKKDEKEVNKFINTLTEAYNTIKPCTICNTLTDSGVCNICTNEKRNHSVICIVEDTKDVFAIENSNVYNGIYHVLGGKVDPLNGVGIDDLNISTLLNRLDKVKEIIFALNPDLEGETTILYLTKLLPKSIKISKIASGIPMGGNIEYTDIVTLTKSLEGRQTINNEQ